MSERSKGGDTSTTGTKSGQSRIVKNSLFSASVTGVTFDDFPNKPLLLPAAPPIDVKRINKETLPTVTVGKTPDIDINTLSEINLNASAEEDSNSNLLEKDGSLLIQAASSFSQLPSVASTVFSTFSKKIKDYTPSAGFKEGNTLSEQYLTDGSAYTSDVAGPFLLTSFTNQSNNNTIEDKPIQEQIIVEPPKLYTAEEIPTLPKNIENQPLRYPPTSGCNSYRLAAAKKVYAPIPDFLTSIENTDIKLPKVNSQQIIENKLPAVVPPSSQIQVNQSETLQHKIDLPSTNFERLEERKGIFSLANFAPTNVFQNLSGLVQSATGSITGIAQTSTDYSVENSSSYHLQKPSVPSSNTNKYVHIQQFPEVLEALQTIQPEPKNKISSSKAISPNHIQSSVNVPYSTKFEEKHFFDTQLPAPKSEQQIKIATAVKPPSGPTPSSSFRLQKGTKLYKSPFSPLPIATSKLPTKDSTLSTASYFTEQQKPIISPNKTEDSQSYILQKSLKADQTLDITSEDIEKITTSSSQNLFTNPSLQIKSDEIQVASFPPTNFEPSPNISNFVNQRSKGQDIQNQNTSSTTELEFVANPQLKIQANASSINETYHKYEKQVNTVEKKLIIPSTSQSNFNWFSTFGPADAKPNTFEENSQNLEQIATDIQSLSGLANFLPPPPQTTTELNVKPISFTNPYRRGSQTLHTVLPTPTLSSIFTPILQDSSPAFDFFESISTETVDSEPNKSSLNQLIEQNSHQDSFTTLEINIANIAAKNNPKVDSVSPLFSSEHCELPCKISSNPLPPSAAINPQLFETAQIDVQLTTSSSTAANIIDDNTVAVAESTPLKSESNKDIKNLLHIPIASPTVSQQQTNILTFFDQNKTAEEPDIQNQLSDPLAFFDSFAASTSPSICFSNESIVTKPPSIAGLSEDPNSQRIQNFFNNPPPQDVPDLTSDLNYNLVGSGLSIKNSQIRSLTPASNLVEPPSSSCSDFSELNSSTSALIAENTSKKTSPPNYDLLPEELVNEIKMSKQLTSDQNAAQSNIVYQPAIKHWFYKKKLSDTKFIWIPFSHYDSERLEDCFLTETNSKIVAVEGGRHDVDILNRTKAPVYWTGDTLEVRRCSWFFKSADSKFIPYEESIADDLEKEYRQASDCGEWHKKILIRTGETVVFHGPTVIVHFLQPQSSDSWGGASPPTTRPRVVKRDLMDFTIEKGESQHVDHLLFMVHGIGSACDLKMRSVEEVVDDFRSIAFQLVQSHYKNSCDSGLVGRIEVLPVSWHEHLHSEELGIDEKLKAITLESIPKLRNFTNDTLLDVLFYTSPVFCQKIMTRVSAAMNSIYAKYRSRHPEFKGGISVAGHSLGSLILFDLLCHQKSHDEDSDEQNKENPDQLQSPIKTELKKREHVAIAKQVSYTMGPAPGTGQPYITYPQLSFQPHKFFALGSPIGMFVTIRGIDKLGLEFKLPTCSGFYNIFHPYDPVAYRIEALVNPDMNGIRPVLIPHHKGRKRMHLELRETMIRVGADIKQKVVDTFRNTMDSVNFLATKKSIDQHREMEKQVDKVLDEDIQNSQQSASSSSYRPRADSTSTQSDSEMIEIDFPLGKLNDSKRIDYVLQEAPLEFFNEYLFALSSHVCYWDSSDTILFVTKEIYSSLCISPDSQVPQQSMTIERPENDESISI